MFLHRIALRNILSFGPGTQELALAPLKMLIGPNGAGKSNLIDAIGLLRAAPTDIATLIRESGGVADWIWHGEPKASSARVDVAEDGRNLGLVLNRLSRSLDVKQRLLKALRNLCAELSDFHVNIEYGTVQVFIQEGNVSVPATRLSDGTLHYLCLLAVLCDPTPPPLVCIQEPELGLHPDAVSSLADLLVEASDRVQLVVTTHSDALVSALTGQSHAIVTCERRVSGTELRRLDPKKLASWLEEYRLGDLRRMGELGANP